MPKTIPDRWEEYNPMGTAVDGTRLIPFKVPLKMALVDRLPEKDAFTPTILIEMLRKSGLELGLVIDLTFTRRYYDPMEFQDQGVEYCKIFTKGHVVPSRDVRDQFNAAVDDFLQRNPDNDKLIGVHCTHGINRTGYIICRYMINRLNFDPDEAIKAVKAARGYGIERQLYIDDLKDKTSASDTQVEDAQSAIHRRERQHDRNDRYGNERYGNERYGNKTARIGDEHYQDYHSCNNSRDWSHDRPGSIRGFHRDSRPDEAKYYNNQEQYNGIAEHHNSFHMGPPRHMGPPGHMRPADHMGPPRYRDVNGIPPYGPAGPYVPSNTIPPNRYGPPNGHRDDRYEMRNRDQPTNRDQPRGWNQPYGSRQRYSQRTSDYRK